MSAAARISILEVEAAAVLGGYGVSARGKVVIFVELIDFITFSSVWYARSMTGFAFVFPRGAGKVNFGDQTFGVIEIFLPDWC